MYMSKILENNKRKSGTPHHEATFVVMTDKRKIGVKMQFPVNAGFLNPTDGGQSSLVKWVSGHVMAYQLATWSWVEEMRWWKPQWSELATTLCPQHQPQVWKYTIENKFMIVCQEH